MVKTLSKKISVNELIMNSLIDYYLEKGMFDEIQKLQNKPETAFSIDTENVSEEKLDEFIVPHKEKEYAFQSIYFSYRNSDKEEALLLLEDRFENFEILEVKPSIKAQNILSMEEVTTEKIENLINSNQKIYIYN